MPETVDSTKTTVDDTQLKKIPIFLNENVLSQFELKPGSTKDARFTLSKKAQTLEYAVLASIITILGYKVYEMKQTIMTDFPRKKLENYDMFTKPKATDKTIQLSLSIDDMIKCMEFMSSSSEEAKQVYQLDGIEVWFGPEIGDIAYMLFKAILTHLNYKVAPLRVLSFGQIRGPGAIVYTNYPHQEKSSDYPKDRVPIFLEETDLLFFGSYLNAQNSVTNKHLEKGQEDGTCFTIFMENFVVQSIILEALLKGLGHEIICFDEEILNKNKYRSHVQYLYTTYPWQSYQDCVCRTSGQLLLSPINK